MSDNWPRILHSDLVHSTVTYSCKSDSKYLHFKVFKFNVIYNDFLQIKLSLLDHWIGKFCWIHLITNSIHHLHTTFSYLTVCFFFLFLEPIWMFFRLFNNYYLAVERTRPATTSGVIEQKHRTPNFPFLQTAPPISRHNRVYRSCALDREGQIFENAF